MLWKKINFFNFCFSIFFTFCQKTFFIPFGPITDIEKTLFIHVQYNKNINQ